MPNQTDNELIKVDVFKKLGLSEGMAVGDLGCGNLAYMSVPAAKIVGKNGVVYAIDILKSVLQSVENIAKNEGLDNIKTVWSNLEIVGATKIPANSLDASLVVNTLFQSDKDDLLIKESYRLTKPGGKMLIVDWLSVSTPFGPKLADRITPEQAKKISQDAGYTLIEEFEAGPYHYGLIFVK